MLLYARFVVVMRCVVVSYGVGIMYSDVVITVVDYGLCDVDGIAGDDMFGDCTRVAGVDVDIVGMFVG